MPKPDSKVLVVFSVFALFGVLLMFVDGDVVQGLIWAGSSTVLLWGLWKHKNGELVEQ